MVNSLNLWLFLLLAGGMIVAYGRWQLSLPEQADYYPAGRGIAPFVLDDGEGQAFTPASLVGHWTFLLLGYTHCPDICPATLADLRTVYPDLKKIAASSQVVFVSVDPQRDEDPRLKRYAAAFHPEFKTTTAPHSQLFPFVRSLGLAYSVPEQGGGHSMDHSADIVLINPAGRLVALFRPRSVEGEVPHVEMQTFISDFARIVRLAGGA